MGMNEVLSQHRRLCRQGWIMERTCGDGKRVVLREVKDAWLSCLQGCVNAAFLKTGILLCKK